MTPQKSLKEYNTFGIDVLATYFTEITTEAQLVEVLLKKEVQKPFFIISGGSNMLLTKAIDAHVLHIGIKGISEKEHTQNSVHVTAKAGESWHEFVQFCIQKNYGGIENLSLIPGYVGSAPIQNIGAYGVELKDTFVQCKAIQIETGISVIFKKEDCAFGYRNSVFKNKLKGHYIITEVTFELTTETHHYKTDYGAIKAELAKQNSKTPTLKTVSQAVIAIRKSKLPDPKILGNSGSFFKNPVIDLIAFQQLQKAYPNAPNYPIDQNTIKIPAGWLVEQAGFKGKRYGDAGIHDKQALVLVNHGNATGNELWQLAQKIQKKVFEKFNIALEAEVNVI